MNCSYKLIVKLYVSIKQRHILKRKKKKEKKEQFQM